MTDLRSKLIRLAHENPDLRPHLLPILKEAADESLDQFEVQVDRRLSSRKQTVVTTQTPFGNFMGHGKNAPEAMHDLQKQVEPWWVKETRRPPSDFRKVKWKMASAKTLRTAHAGNEILSRMVDERRFVKLYDEVEKQDEQSADLLLKVRGALVNALKISDNEYNALNRVQQLVASQGRWDIGLQRNNIFKAANLLGIKLPSAMF